MPAFRTDIDIMNRALQHCRQERIESIAEHNKPAREIGFMYHKLREAELRSNLWRFATRQSALRAITTTTQLWTPPTYLISTIYGVGYVVADDDGRWWQSKIVSNEGNTPVESTYWAPYFGPDTADVYADDTSYFAGEVVQAGDSFFLSLLSGNDEDPTLSDQWIDVAGSGVELQILYPIGAGPWSQTSSSNVFRLPHGFLRQAPADPRGGVGMYLGLASGRPRNDWVLEGDYIVTPSTGPIILRYVANTTDVLSMDPMFCEMLGARLAEEAAPAICDLETINAIIRRMARIYTTTRYKAIRVNSIEVGPVTQELDSFITCRY